MNLSNDNKSRFPFGFYYSLTLIAICVGLFTSIYLEVSHYRVYTDIGYKSFCAVSKTINCDTVSQSPYSIFLSIPVPVWGVLGYGLLFIIVCYAWRARLEGKALFFPTFLLISLVFSIYSIILGLISTFFIRSYCIMCILTYAVNFFLVYICWLIIKRFFQGGVIGGLIKDFRFFSERIKIVCIILVCCMIVIATISHFMPKYWRMNSVVLTSDLPQGISQGGHPWIGATDPQITVIEYTDYQCFQCKKMHYYLRQLMAKYPDKIRLIHMHFPMDHAVNPIVRTPYHKGSGKLSLIALYAAIQGKFWEMNDFLFSLQQSKDTIEIKAIAAATGLNPKDLIAATQNAYLRRMLRADILSGINLGITGTPGYIVDGKLYLGTFPVEILSNLEGHTP
ncbi:vitamin K epoxide reductase family protein [Desulfosarcina widdelii]|nr:vitamin K epoxide reductase family protein [Desulfosarcina widdelii]